MGNRGSLFYSFGSETSDLYADPEENKEKIKKEQEVGDLAETIYVKELKLLSE